MTRRIVLPTVVYTADITVIALVVVWITTLALSSQAVSISSGVTAGWLAAMYLPCPCHRHGGRR